MCQAVNRTRILRSALLQRIGLFDRCFIDSVAGMTAKAKASTDDNELGAIVRSDHCDVVENSLDNHGTHHKNLLGKPDDRLFNSNRAGSVLTKVDFSERSHITKTVGSKPAAGPRRNRPRRGLARVDMVLLSNKRMEALALKFSSVDSDMQHHLSRAIVGHDAQRVLSRNSAATVPETGAHTVPSWGTTATPIAHGTAAKSGVVVFLGEQARRKQGEDFELGGCSLLLIRTAHQARKETHGGMSFINIAQPNQANASIEITPVQRLWLGPRPRDSVTFRISFTGTIVDKPKARTIIMTGERYFSSINGI